MGFTDLGERNISYP